MEKQKYENWLSKIFYGICILIALAGLLLQIRFSFSKDIWTDESFSLAMIEHGYLEMIQLTAMDVHPPLYYLILKAVVDLVQAIAPSISVIYIAKIVSVIPYILLVIVCNTKIREKWGIFVAGMWMVTLVGMPNLIGYGVEIRMYSWGLFFVTMAYLYTYELMQREYKLSNWVWFTVFSLLAAYTHYFACITVAVFYAMLLIWFVIQQRECIKRWLIMAGVTVLGYLPWLIVVIQQLQEVNDSYWISDITGEDIQKYIKFIFEKNWLLWLTLAVAVLCIIGLCCSKKKRCDRVYALLGIMAPIATMLIGVGVSFAFRPVFIARYMLPGLACLWLGFLIAVRLLDKSYIKLLIFILLIMLSKQNMEEFKNDEIVHDTDDQRTESLIADNEKVFFLSDNYHAYNVLAKRTNKESYLWKKEVPALYLQVYDNVGTINTLEEIEEKLEAGYTVYFAHTYEDLTVEELLEGSDISYENLGWYYAECVIEMYRLYEE